MKYIFILSFFLFQLPIYSSLGLADLVVLLLNVFYIVGHKIKLPKTKYKNLIIVFLCWLLFQPFFLDEFDGIYFINRILRLVNLFLGVLIIPSLIFRNKKDLFKGINFLCIICGLLFILTTLEFIFIQLNFNFDIRLLNRDVMKINSKPYSIYSEPSILAIVLTFSNYIIYYSKNIFIKFKTFYNYILLFNVVTILLTLTFTGIIGLLSFLILTLNTKAKIYVIISFFILALFSNLNVDIINENFTQRFDKIINNEDNSANQRLIGSWTIPYLFLDNINIGVGAGQEISFFEQINTRGIENMSELNLKINNSLALVFLENGVIGLVIFLLLILSFYRVYYMLPIVILFYTFSHGSYFSSVLWLPIILFISLNLNQKSETSNLKLKVRKTIL